MVRFFALIAFALFASVLQPAPAAADPADIEAASRGVVRVVIIGNDGPELFPISHGTGFSVDQERIVTNAHVVADAVRDDRLDIGIVPADGDEAVYARIIAVSERNDLALLATTEPLGLPPMTIAGNPAQSGPVTAIGYPLNVDRAQGLSFSDMFRAQPPVTATGFLSGRRPSRDFDTLLHTAPIASGNSGGPLVDQCGRVLGVNSFGAESQGSDAEFFFAVSTRELLPFLRANGVTPRINSAECRSMEDLNAQERARELAERNREEERALAAAAALDNRTAELRRNITYEVMDERSNKLAFAFLLLLIGTGAGGIAAFAHRAHDYRMRAIGGAIALVAVIGAAIAWFTRPAFSEIDERVEETLREGMPDTEGSGPIPIASTTGAYTCVLETARSRYVGDPTEDLTIDWSEDGCVNGRTQYGLDNGEWTRVFVPGSEAVVSVNKFDPADAEFIMERYLLSRAPMTTARSARAQYQAPSCGAGQDAALQLGGSQNAILSSLPDMPNERLVYSCTLNVEVSEEAVE
ncbi:S1C family serine protease [Aurantiacibacter sediminis]|uniref:Trypsin-like peptidase domain-containing protein n=1 Tax=Aurantiacibacter sediminis TaxID=2793064 RepID=A0ABS0N5D8_9SPHN|nr:serine protease [Aurantiacibacter sediminis]MBH5323010.1 trypsin-like peptidase domain-containing protein [Aurantiacibacter sediminis]